MAEYPYRIVNCSIPTIPPEYCITYSYIKLFPQDKKLIGGISPTPFLYKRVSGWSIIIALPRQCKEDKWQKEQKQNQMT